MTSQYGVDESRLLEAVSAECGVPLESLEGAAPPSQALKILPADFAGRCRMLPLRVEEGELVLAVSDPFDVFAQDDVRLRTGMEIRLVLASDRSLDEAIARAYAPRPAAPEEPLDDLLASLEAPEEPGAPDVAASVAFLDSLLQEAALRGVEAIHIEPAAGNGDVQIRLRESDRKLTRVEPPAGVRLSALMARVKILAQLDIAERRRAQDGRINVNVRGRSVMLRCATFPTVAGESATLVVIQERASPRTLAESDAPEALVASLRAALSNGGLTLAASADPRRGEEFLGMLARDVDAKSRVAIGIGCDPGLLPEGFLPMAVNVDAGMTFAAGIHAALRQDPDVIVVAEIRDSQTLKLAIDCAEAGVAVLARLHVDSATELVQRLLLMDADAPRLAEALRLAVCRHAVRRHGREVFLYEVLENRTALKRAIASRADSAAIAQAAAACGLKTFRELESGLP